MPSASLAGALTLALALAACDRPAEAGSLPEWSPSDHHSADDDKAPSPGRAAAEPAARGAGGDVSQLVDLAWRQQCVRCHGATGHGDGPDGPMVRAHDLTDAAWQSQASDADIAAVITGGRNRMPKFDTLPAPVVAGLVARIRQMKGR